MTTPIAPGTTVPIRSADGLLHLSGRAGYTLDLIPGAAEKQYAWEPDVVIDPHTRKRKALATDYDLQVQWLSAAKPENNAPLVYWRIQYGHGELSYAMPPTTALDTADPVASTIEIQQGWFLPNRGLRLRIPAREIRLWFRVPPVAPPPEPVVLGGAPCKIQVSCQPCSGLEPEILPYTDAVFGGDPPTQLPLGCTVMRLCDPTTGLPFAAATSYIDFLDATGAIVNVVSGPVDAALFADWQQIPIWAAFWVPVQNSEVAAQFTQASYK